MTIKFYAKHLLIVFTVLILGIPAEIIKKLSFSILSLVANVLDSPAFNFVTGGEPIFGEYYNIFFAGLIAEGMFTVTIIYLNYMIFKKLIKWNLSFTPSIVFLTVLLAIKWTKNIFFMGDFANDDYAMLYDLATLTGMIGSLLPIYFAYKGFDRNGNWTGIKN